MSPDRFEVLYERYCDGDLAAEEREEFLESLATAEGRARYVELSTFAAVLADEVRCSAVTSEERASSRRLPAVRLAARRARARRPASNLPVGLIIGIAAAGLVGFVALLASGSGGPKPPPGTPRAEPVAERPPAPVEPPREIRPEVPRAPEPHRSPRVEARDPEPFVVPPPRPPEPDKPIVPAPVPPEPPRPTPRPAETETTVAVVAHVEAAAGTVSVPAGKGLRSGEGIETGADGYALVRMGDGTRVELGVATSLARLAERSAQLERGLIAVEAARQQPGKPLVFGTPHAEAAVLGTEFTLWAAPAFTRLDVREGRVKFSRPSGVSSVFVGAGQFAVAGQGELSARTASGSWKAPGQGLLLWLRSDAGTRVSGARLASWTDATGLQAVQPLAAAQPALVPNAWAGRPAVRFDGADDHLELPAGFSDFRAGLSVFVVARVEAGPLWMRFLDLGKGPQCDNIFFGRKDGPNSLCLWVYANSVTRGKVDAPEGLVPDQVQSLSALMTQQGKVALYRNGAPVGAGSTSTPATVVRKPNYIGRSNYGGGDPTLKGDLYELLLFNRALSDAERQYLEAYFALKYFDPTLPPALARPQER